MADRIDVTPEVVDLILYAGDGVSFKVSLQDSAGAPLDITGTAKAQIRLARLDPDPAVEEFAVNLSESYLGNIRLSLTGAQTQALSVHPSAKQGKFTGVWDVQWQPINNEPFTLCQGKVECGPDVTR